MQSTSDMLITSHDGNFHKAFIQGLKCREINEALQGERRNREGSAKLVFKLGMFFLSDM